MADYHIAACLIQLEKEISQLFPETPWPKGYGDGAIGDASHQARKSDHNPDWSDNGVVRANDFATGGRDRILMLKTFIGDPRVWYVINKGVIWSRTHGWEPLKYHGLSSHPHHIHVSIQGANGISDAKALKIERDTSRWFDPVDKTPAKPKVKPVIYTERIREQFVNAATKKHVEKRGGVAIVQAALNRRGFGKLQVDGVAGLQTLRAWAKWEQKRGVEGRPGVPNDRSDIAALVGAGVVVK